jgi:prepilin-type N-terminal cleavage/methylation domain-containing protein/prepilin-type processing-associated H-X9-DG protein
MVVSREGFTLIELLVVVAIIAVLAAILFPVLAQAKAAARKAGDVSHLRQAALAAAQYGADYDERWPTHSREGDFLVPEEFEAPSGYAVENWAVAEEPNYAKLLLAYTGGSGLFKSPASAGWSPQADPQAFDRPTNYAYNGFNIARSASEAPDPSGIALLWSYAYQTPWAMANPAPSPEGAIQGWFRVAPPHLREGNAKGQFGVAFIDGHVEIKKRDAWQTQTEEDLKELTIWVY